MFSLMAICYLFLGGAGAGAVCVLAFLSLLVPRERIAASRLSVSGRRRRSVAYVPAVYRRFFAPGFAVSILALVAGISVAVYTGLLFSDMKAVPLWATPVLPLLFAVSSLSCGCAVVVGTACFSGTLSVFGSVLRQVANADAALLVLVSSVGVLIGGFVLRYGIVLAGVHPSVYAVVL